MFTNIIDMIEAEALEIDGKFAMNVSEPELLATYHEAAAEVTEADQAGEALQTKIDDNEAVMRICVGKDARASNMRRKPSVYKPEDAWAVKYQAAKRQCDNWAAELKSAKARAAAAQKRVDTAMEEIAKLMPDKGPMSKRFYELIDGLGVKRDVYFGGTYTGPQLEKILGKPENLTRLANVLAAGRFKCPDQVEREFGSDARAAQLDAVMQPFGKLHRLFNRKEPLCEHEIASFGPLVSEYACAFATAFPKVQPTPKMHVLRATTWRSYSGGMAPSAWTQSRALRASIQRLIMCVTCSDTWIGISQRS